MAGKGKENRANNIQPLFLCQSPAKPQKTLGNSALFLSEISSPWAQDASALGTSVGLSCAASSVPPGEGPSDKPAGDLPG